MIDRSIGFTIGLSILLGLCVGVFLGIQISTLKTSAVASDLNVLNHQNDNDAIDVSIGEAVNDGSLHYSNEPSIASPTQATPTNLTDNQLNSAKPAIELEMSAETQNFIQNATYETVAQPSVNSVAYLDKIECKRDACEMNFHFYDTRSLYTNAASVMSELNDRLAQNSSTRDIQVAFRQIAIDETGIGVFDLKTVPRTDRQYNIRFFSEHTNTTSDPN